MNLTLRGKRIAEWMGPNHPCYMGGGEYDHIYKLQDDSFDHEYGTEQVYYFRCEVCGAEEDYDPGAGGYGYGEDWYD